MHPILFRIGQEPIYTYSVLMTLIVPLALAGALWEDWRNLDETWPIFRGAFWTMVAAVLGGRLAFMLAHSAYYRERPQEILAFWGAGINGYGAFVAGLFGLAIFYRIHLAGNNPRLPFWAITNVFTPVLPLIASVGWLAHLLAGSAYGRVVQPAAFPLTVYWPDLYGLYAIRIPTQLLGLALSLVMIPVLIVVRRSRFAHVQFTCFLVFYFAGLFLLEFTRGDEAVQLLGLRTGQWVAVAAVVWGIGSLWTVSNRGDESLLR